MKILLLSTYDHQAGGAERVASDLLQWYRKDGHDVRMAVRHRRSMTPGVTEITPYDSRRVSNRLFVHLERRLRAAPRFRGQYRLVDVLRRTAAPRRWSDRWRGIEDFNYPASVDAADHPDWRADIVHAHNLHGDYFDLRALAALSRTVPVVWTLHDAWALTGHCAYFIDCNHWLTGCGRCPDLRRAPAILRDNTAANWRRKRQIYASARLAVATPSRWLMDCVERSSMDPEAARVIPNGVDLTTYRSGDRKSARRAVGLPEDGFFCLFVAQGAADGNPYKDFGTVRGAIARVIQEKPRALVRFVSLGGTPGPGAEGRDYPVGYISDSSTVALYYQAADVLLHAATAENFPCVILEALACGTPVVATAVGGIPEQITDGRNGFLVPRHDSGAMAARVLWLMDHPDVSRSLGETAAVDAQRLGWDRQARVYLDWFAELRTLRRGRPSGPDRPGRQPDDSVTTDGQ